MNESHEPAEAVTVPPAAVPPSKQATLSHAGGTPPVFADGGPAAVPGYEILGELGRGGMGVVYKARQTKLDRVVALKMILAGGHAGAADLARFRTEAEAVARLQHPNIVQIFEVGEHAGLPFIALEFCGGGGLDEKLAGTPLPPRETASLLEKLARAVQAAHVRSVVHRDLKPANVLLTEDGQPKITDFGLAKKIGEAGQTQTGAVMGTPSYMAPEQAGGKTAEMGPPCDIYSLGAILYECLTGRPPFKAATAMDTMLQAAVDDPVPPRRLQSKTPPDLETICLKCLEKQPGRRYGTARELAEDLRRFLDGEPIAARPAGAAGRAWRWAKRRPAAAALVAVSALALLTLLAGGLMYNALLQDSNSRLQTSLSEVKRLREQEKGRYEEQLREVNRQLGLRSLRTLTLAMVFYIEKHDGRLPPPALYARDGTPLLSWRVTLLPTLGEEGQALYNRFKLDEAWDGPHNRPLLKEMPLVYAPAEGSVSDPSLTFFQVFTGEHTPFDGREGVRYPAGFLDGTSNTFLIVEGGEPVPWTKPEDLAFDPGGPLPKLGGLNPKGFYAAMADGSVHLIPRETPEDVIRAYITRDGGEEVNPPSP